MAEFLDKDTRADLVDSAGQWGPAVEALHECLLGFDSLDPVTRSGLISIFVGELAYREISGGQPGSIPPAGEPR